MITAPGYYYYRQSTNRLDNCRITILADHYTLIELTLVKLDMYCNEDDEYILFIDGLLYKGKYFPHERLDPENSKYIERVHSMCMNGEWKIIKIGQNAAQINHRMRMNQGFTFYVNFTRQKNPRKFIDLEKRIWLKIFFFFVSVCHFILQAQHLDFDQIYLLHNERGAKNCSISIANLPFTKKSPMNYLAITMTDAKLHTEKRGIDTAKILKERQPVINEL